MRRVVTPPGIRPLLLTNVNSQVIKIKQSSIITKDPNLMFKFKFKMQVKFGADIKLVQTMATKMLILSWK